MDEYERCDDHVEAGKAWQSKCRSSCLVFLLVETLEASDGLGLLVRTKPLPDAIEESMANETSAEQAMKGSEERRGPQDISSSAAPCEQVQVTRLPTWSSKFPRPDEQRSTYHIYPKKERHRQVQSTINLKNESLRSAVKRNAVKAKKEAKEKGVVAEVETTGDKDDAFFLHWPYLAFHNPPQVLYIGPDNRATPAVLIHSNAFWRKYKLQYGRSIATPGVLDPRGVVCWKHNGGDKKALKVDDTKLKGYKVRTWRLWGECGKPFVHNVKANRKAGIGPDPDVLVDPETGEKEEPVKADGVVYLKWERPFSRHTRRYHFHYGDIDFYWKGTGTVKKSKLCGIFVRFNHLKLIAKRPSKTSNKKDRERICLALYASSIGKKKCGRLELFDSAILRLAEDYVQPIGEIGVEEDEGVKIQRLKKTMLYAIIVATGLCMIAAEKEKREAVWEWLQEAAENGGG